MASAQSAAASGLYAYSGLAQSDDPRANLSLQKQIRYGRNHTGGKGFVSAVVQVGVDDWKSLQKLYYWSALLHLLGFVFASQGTSKPDTLPIWDYTFRPEMIDDSVRFEYIGFAYLGVMFLYYAYAGWKAETVFEELKEGINIQRWKAFAVSFPLQMIQFAFIGGAVDLQKLVLVGGLGFAWVVFGAILELLFALEERKTNKALSNTSVAIDGSASAVTLSPAQRIVQLVRYHLFFVNAVIWLILWWFVLWNLNHLQVAGRTPGWEIYAAVALTAVITAVITLMNTVRSDYFRTDVDKNLSGPRRYETLLTALILLSQLSQSALIFGGVKENSYAFVEQDMFTSLVTISNGYNCTIVSSN